MIDDFRDFLFELVEARARFMVVGAHALSVHGLPRATVDLDVWIDADPGNARRVWNALAAFGAPLDDLDVSEDDLTRPNVVVQFGLPPFRIDILTSVSGVAFAEAWPERVEGVFGDVPAPVIGRAALIRNKRASGRTKDLGDLESLGEPHPPTEG
jgi:hypothetical protein